MDLTEGQRQLAAIWGNIQAAVRDPAVRSRPGGVTSYVWQSYYSALEGGRGVPPSVTIQDMNRLVGAAGAIARAERSLGAAIATYQRTGIDQAIVASHTAPDLDARALSELGLGPNYRIRYQAQVVVDGEPMLQTFTWSAGLAPPATVSELLDSLEQDAQANADDYDLQFQELGDLVSITTV